MTNPDIINVVYQGKLTIDDISESTLMALGIADDTKPSLFLTELLDVDIDMASYELHNILYLWEITGAHPRNRLAIVDEKPNSSGELLNFFVVSCQNMGWQVQSFHNREHAINWLVQSEHMPEMPLSLSR